MTRNLRARHRVEPPTDVPLPKSGRHGRRRLGPRRAAAAVLAMTGLAVAAALATDRTPGGVDVVVADPGPVDGTAATAPVPGTPSGTTTATATPSDARTPGTPAPEGPTTTASVGSARPGTATPTGGSASRVASRTTSRAAAPSGAARPGWSLVWADEFDGGTVDPTRWAVEHLSTYGDGNNELACLMNRPENVFQADGVLTLRARRESTPIACGTADGRFPGGRPYTSAMVRTVASWTYGRFELRARLPTVRGTSKGLWPAFWLRPAAGGTGELDVLEVIGTGSDTAEARRVHQTIWYDYADTHPMQTFTARASFDPSAGFHTYAAEWEPGVIRWYVDGDLTYTRTASTTSWLDEAFSKPFLIRLNLAVGGDWPGSPDQGTSFPADYQVDYVRVYQR